MPRYDREPIWVGYDWLGARSGVEEGQGLGVVNDEDAVGDFGARDTS